MGMCVCVCVRADICVVKGQQNLNNEKSLLNFPQRAQPTLQPCKPSAVCLRIYVISTIFVVVVVGVSFFMPIFFLVCLRPFAVRPPHLLVKLNSKFCLYMCTCVYVYILCICVCVCLFVVKVSV